MCFINANLPERKSSSVTSWKKLNELSGYHPNILKKSNIDRYMGRPSATFCNEKYTVLNDFCDPECFNI